MNSARHGEIWAAWMGQEFLQWAAALALCLALPWAHYQHALAPHLGEIHTLQKRLDQELSGLDPATWETWAGQAMHRVQIAAEQAIEKANKASVPVKIPDSDLIAPPPKTTRLRATAPSKPKAQQRGGLLLRVEGTGPEDIVWTAVNEFYAAPYRWGGNNTLGIDCSGLVQQVFKRLGVALPRTAQGQFDSSLGVYIGLDHLQPGDLLFFHTRSKPYISHVGIYVGKGEFLHAPRSGSRVEVAALSGYYQKRFVAAKRLLANPFAAYDDRSN